MRTIESKNDFISWASEVNRGITLARKCDMQDIYAHTTVANIDKFFLEADGERKLILCSINNCMAFEEVERLIVVLAKDQARKQLARHYGQLEKEEYALQARIKTFEESKKPIFKRIEELRREAGYFLERTNHFRTLYQQEATKLQQYQDKANKFDTLKNILS